MKLSLKSMIIAGALFKTIGFLLISLMNLVLRPYGGAYLALLTSLYPGYDPVSMPIGLVVGTSIRSSPERWPASFSAGFIICSQNEARHSKSIRPFRSPEHGRTVSNFFTPISV